MAGEAASVANTPSYRRLTSTDLALALKYAKDGLTQVEIAKRLGVTQSAISQWLSKCEDSTEAAISYLRGQSLRMAKNVVKKGQARDHVKVLQGLNVLERDQAADIKLLVGFNLPGMPDPQGVVVDADLPIVSEKSLTIQRGSDNQRSVNEDAEGGKR